MSTWKIKDGKYEDFEQFTQRFVSLVEESGPQLIGFHVFVNETRTEMTSIQIHPDAASMDLHMQNVNRILGEDMAEWVERADFLEPKHIEIFGEPSETLIETDQPAVDAGIPRTIKPIHIAGFTRSSAG